MEDSAIPHDEPDVDQTAGSSGRKKKGVFGKIKGIFGGSSKRRTRSSDGGKIQRKEKTESIVSDQLAQQAQNTSTNQMSVSADSIFTAEQEDDNSDVNTSVSMEEINKKTAGKIIFKGELEKRLQKRRSLEDDGLPASPLQTPPSTHGLLSQPEFTGSRNYRKSMNGSRNSTGIDSSAESDMSGSLVSINSSEDEFFNNKWKSGTTHIRGITSSDSESDVDMQFDLDLVSKTEKLSNQAAKDKARIRPRKNTKKARRPIVPTNVMPSVIEKNVLEIAHTFLDDGDTKPKPAVRKIETKLLEGTTTEMRMSDPSILQDSPRLEKSPKPVTRSHTSVTASTRQPPPTSKKSASLGRNIDSNELFSAFTKIKSGNSNPEKIDQSNQSLPAEPNNTSNSITEMNNKPTVDRPPSPAQPPPQVEVQDETTPVTTSNTVMSKSVIFQSSPPTIRNKKQPPVAAPRPKSMVYTSQTNTFTEKSDPSETVNENKLSKSYNGAINNTTSNTANTTQKTEEKTPSTQPPVIMRENSSSHQPDWIKLAQRKTVAVASEIDSSIDFNNKTNTQSQPGVPPKPASRINSVKSGNTAPTIPTKPANNAPTIPSKPMTNAPLIPSKPVRPNSQKTEVKQEEKPVILRKTSPTDICTGLAAETKNNSENETKDSPELLVKSRNKTNPISSTVSNNTSTANPGEDDAKPVPPWKTNLRSRPASMKPSPSQNNPTPSAAPRPNWRNSTVESSNTRQVITKLNNETTEQSQPMFKSPDDLLNKPVEVISKDRPVSMVPNSAVKDEITKESSSEAPKSVRDMLRKFQS